MHQDDDRPPEPWSHPIDHASHPVLDVRQGQAVRALAGNRDQYRPLQSVLLPGTDPVALARAGRDTWRLNDLYLADLDAILGDGAPALELYRKLGDLGLTLWVDPGVRDLEDLKPLLGARVSKVVVGLETVEGPAALARILDQAGPDRVAFSLDLRQGRPLVDTRKSWGTDQPAEIARHAVTLGLRRLIEIDLARVGTGQGVEPLSGLQDLEVERVIGGGIRGFEDVRNLASQGFSAVLIGAALHDGRIISEDLTGRVECSRSREEIIIGHPTS